MTQQDRISVGEMWMALAQAFGRDLSDSALMILLNAVSDLPYPKVERFMQNWARTSKAGRHPYPAEVIEGCGNKTADNKFLAIEASTRVLQAIQKFGDYEPNNAKLFIGDLGWRGVQRFGGWPHLCSQLGVSIQVTTFTAQLRDALQAILELKECGIDDEPIMIERKSSSGHLVQAGKINFLDLMPSKVSKSKEDESQQLGAQN